MKAHEVAEAIVEPAHGHAEAAEAAGMREASFRRRAAVYIAIMGMLLAIASLGGEYHMKETINANIQASDTYSFYQARNIRQTGYQIAADGLAELLATQPDLTPAARAAVEKRLDSYKALIERWESDPKASTGKKELLEKALDYEAARDKAQRQDLNFEFSRALFEIAIVLGSVSILVASPAMMSLCAVLAALATALMLNGYFLFADLPLHFA